MENSLSRILIETTVRQTLKGLQENPKRSTRNLIDMALQFSEGRFQSHFFETAQTLLKNEDSAYYALVQDTASHIETEHMVKFGMNLGYNSCTWGAQQIRLNEIRLGFNIPSAFRISAILCGLNPLARISNILFTTAAASSSMTGVFFSVSLFTYP